MPHLPPPPPHRLLRLFSVIMYVCTCSEAKLVDSLRGGDVRGVTLLNDKLYVLRAQELDDTTWFQFDVYFNEDSAWKPHRTLTVAGQDLTDVASCAKQQCLYVCDSGSRMVRKLSLDVQLVGSWPVDETPVGISVMPNSYNVLVTSGENSTLLELDCESGQCSPFVTLPEEVQSPRHAIQLSSGEVLVSHGEENVHLVRKIGTDGDIICIFGEEVEDFLPCQMAVDKDGFVLVADYWNERVVLLSPSLEFVRDIWDLGGGTPHRLCLDHFHRTKLRLFVGVDKKVSVVEL